MTLPHMTIRVRLTLWYSFVLLLLLASASVGTYLLVRARLERNLAVQLDRDVDTVATVLAASPKGAGRNGHLRGDILFLVSEGGRVVYHSEGWCRTKPMHGVDATLHDGTGVWRSLHGQAYRVKTTPLTIGGRTFEARVAEDVSVVDETLGALLRILLLSLPVATLFSVGGGYFLAGRALSPIGAMASKAREITAESLSERLPVASPDDELGRVATVFNETLGRLEGSFDRLRAFTSNVSHELRTPLTAMRSVGEVALRRPLESDAARDAIGSMLEEVERMTRLVDCMLSIARAESAQLPLATAEVDLAAVADSAVELVRVLAEEKNQALVLEPPQPMIVRADAVTLRQALSNLLDNAIRYTPFGGRIRLSVSCSAGGGAVVDVEDNGVPIAPEERDRIFDRFHRASAGVGEARGLGLGLAIARSAVEANGGWLEYQAPPSGGNRFRILLRRDARMT